MNQFIRVQPAPDKRRNFARWATAQDPKVRTVSSQHFAVPHFLFTDMPEPLLIGATVDGHVYVSPDDGQPAELLGVFLPEQEAVPGQPLPHVPEEAYPAGAKPLPEPDYAPIEDAPAEHDSSDSSDPAYDTRSEGDDGLTCCGRTFKNERGLATHRRQAHPEA
ncbi:hypothetical protein GTY54_48425 [Streptomyces sp. SID625]|nr:hypothetical protein [Streptomyces sp. SID625]